jgi:putative membrane protein
MLSARWVLLSRLSYTLIFVFLSLHEVGAHYTYSEVPYDAWFQALTGRSLNALLGWDRNHFDRFVHFGYGVLLAYPAHELFRRAVGARGAWAYLVPLQCIMTLSVTYELIEWAAALAFGGDLGIAYVGAQGDVWDGQKDMALAGAGGLLGLGATALGNRRRPASRGTGVDRVGRTA